MTKPIQKTIEVSCDPKQAFRMFTDKITTWWPLDKNSVSAMSGEVAKAVTLEPREGGELYETGFYDTKHKWGTVKVFEPGERLILNCSSHCSRTLMCSTG